VKALRLLASLAARAVILAVLAYQKVVSPLLPPACRYTPTCSQYMIEAIDKKGLVIGLLKGLWRIVRCNPLLPGGYDPVR